LVVPEPDARARDGSRSADLAAAIPEAELYIRDAAPSAEQSFAARVAAGAVAVLAQLDALLVLRDSAVLRSQPERGSMERSLEEQLLEVLLPQVEPRVATRLLWDLLALAELQE
jgi:hypothetical protein